MGVGFGRRPFCARFGAGRPRGDETAATSLCTWLLGSILKAACTFSTSGESKQHRTNGSRRFAILCCNGSRSGGRRRKVKSAPVWALLWSAGNENSKRYLTGRGDMSAPLAIELARDHTGVLLDYPVSQVALSLPASSQRVAGPVEFA